MFSKLVTFLISPLGTALLAGMAASWWAWRGLHQQAIRWGLAALLWLWCWSTPWVSMGLRGAMESVYPSVPVTELPAAQVIVVLGGGIEVPQSGRPDLNQAADRMWHAARLYKAGKAPVLILSGGLAFAEGTMSEAASMQVFLRDLGVPDAAMLLEERSVNTRENAQFTAQLMHEKGMKSLLLVTSALHMPRSVRLYEAQGLKVIPAATDHEFRTYPVWRSLVPDAQALDGSGRAFKEALAWLLSFLGVTA